MVLKTTLLICLISTFTFASETRIARARQLTDAEITTLVGTLFRSQEAALSEDPSCKSDLSVKGPKPIREALATLVANAAIERAPVKIRASCFVRKSYKLDKGEEYCKFEIAGPKQLATGLVFKMMWSNEQIVPGSAECF
jgi:hypothetical protein